MLRLFCEQEQSLKEFTENNYAQASFFWNTLLKNKEIKVNGKKVGADVRLSVGDEICYYLTAKQAEKPAFFTVYEDENILVADKESGVNSEAVFAALRRERECYFIHRLDRNTCGLLVFALTESAERELLSVFKERRVEKKYHALCFGKFPKRQAVLTAYLKKDEKHALSQVFEKPVLGAEKIITEYSVLEENGETTLVEVTLHTGKTHQIRAHLSRVGCPIVGDMKYGDADKNKKYKTSRQRLVAKKLSFSFSGKLAYLNGKTWTSRFEANFMETE